LNPLRHATPGAELSSILTFASRRMNPKKIIPILNMSNEIVAISAAH